ncbi:Haloacid dehalogenase-like hydrolase-domain-containing protein [Microdochium trichocladiopsis]|uniref:Haloacid dehalogenase-like hydrolase-domain-containing protein n=1 Tax=Microdochium trichocladiopsis TaxID=1682393 RepID=A0A9P8Y071_9PEZI|nr:Haloacid dehalogenase-like hydrolase-domain-containing protein [Microdochium trichocladiopsis]KAH7025275.1 Haloacid dehalogenase-like hydrolase-domain-containing protein [Microdochium trichocladiopsis]
MPTSRPIESFKCLTFDCFGTLVDWETGIYTALSPLTQQLPASHPLQGNRLGVLRLFILHENRVQLEDPAANYKTVLSETYRGIATELGLEAAPADMARFGHSVGEWVAFPDTVDALKRLQKHLKLVILSNVDRESFDRTLAGPLREVKFDAVYVAEDIGSYKPDLRNFEYLLEHCQKDLGIGKDDIIHTAQSLFHDHVPANKMGLPSAWIERDAGVVSVMGGEHEDLKNQVDFSWHFKTMGDMADAVDAAHAAAAARH